MATSEHSLSRLVDALDQDSLTHDSNTNNIKLQETELWELDKEFQKDLNFETPREDESSLDCYTVPPADESFCQELESFELSALDESHEDGNDANASQTRAQSQSPATLNLDSTAATPTKIHSQQRTSVAIPDDNDEVLQETRRECDALREMNQRLLKSNQEYKDSLGLLILSHAYSILDATEMQVRQRIDNVRVELESLAASSIVIQF